FFATHLITSWEILYRAIMAANSRKVPVLDTS
ncbi:MAG: hypothetical protein ACI9S8_002669, partial [Chlamydiales bacterium]